MDWRKHERLFVSIFFFILVFLLPTLSSGQGQEKLSTKDIQEVVDLLEDSQKRETFVKDLKNLKQLKEATVKEGEEKKIKPPDKEREVLFIENLFVKFESLSGKVMEAATSTFSLVTKTPEAFREVKSFLSRSENLFKLIKLFGDIAGGIIIAFIISLFLRKPILKINDRMTTLTSKVTLGLLKVVLTLVPYGVLLASLFILFKILPSFPMGHSLSLLFFTILFFYRAALEVFRVLLSPDEARIRLLPFSDEYANYGWVWVLRFVNYTAFYALVTWTLLVVNVSSPAQYFIRGILLLLFPFMISVFIMQVARGISMKHGDLQKETEDIKTGSNKIISYVVRYWHPLVIAYCWIIFLFLMPFTANIS